MRKRFTTYSYNLPEIAKNDLEAAPGERISISGLQAAVGIAMHVSEGILNHGRDLILTGILGPGVRLDKRLKGIGVRVTR